MNGSFAFRKAINLGEFHFLSKAHFQHGSKRIPSQGIQYDEGGEIYQELSIGTVHRRSPNPQEEVRAHLQLELSTLGDVTSTGIEDEATLGIGKVATLNLLKERGTIKATESSDLTVNHREK